LWLEPHNSKLNNNNNRMNNNAGPNAIDASPPLASGNVEDFCAPEIPVGAIVTDQDREDAAKEFEKRSLLRELNPNFVTAAELMRSKRRKVAVENTAAFQAHPQAHQNVVSQAIQALEARITTELRNLGAEIRTRTDNLGAEIRTRLSNNVKVCV
jgi:hypothetical protein